MSLFNFRKKNAKKRREEYCTDAKTFIRVHFVRERDSERYAYNTLSLKSDPERELCLDWYAEHNNPSTYNEIVCCYLDDTKISAETICERASLEPEYFNKLKQSNNYRPGKGEAVAVSIGLRLNYSEVKMFLNNIGYPLTNSVESDLVIRFLFEEQIYNISDFNYVLFKVCGMKLKDIN